MTQLEFENYNFTRPLKPQVQMIEQGLSTITLASMDSAFMFTYAGIEGTEMGNIEGTGDGGTSLFY